MDISAVSVYGFKVSFEDLTNYMKKRTLSDLEKQCKDPAVDGAEILKVLQKHIRGYSKFFSVRMCDGDTDYSQNDFFLGLCNREVKETKSPLYTKTDEDGAIDEITDEERLSYRSIWDKNEAAIRADFESITGHPMDADIKAPSTWQWFEAFEKDDE
jgi:hypothetical protein